jgi:hypothetical protein
MLTSLPFSIEGGGMARILIFYQSLGIESCKSLLISPITTAISKISRAFI